MKSRGVSLTSQPTNWSWTLGAILITILSFFILGITVGFFIVYHTETSTLGVSDNIGVNSNKFINNNISKSYLRKNDIELDKFSDKLLDIPLVTSNPSTLLEFQFSEELLSLYYPPQSLHLDQRTYVTLPSLLDSKVMTIGLWLYLDDIETNFDMRIIISNKQTGCETNDEQYGFALYVNSWQTNNMNLILEYGGYKSGCNKVSSDSFSLKSLKWYYVVATFSELSARLYVDGILIAMSDNNAELHQIQLTRSFRIGQLNGNLYPLFGKVAHVTVVSQSSDDDNIFKTIMVHMLNPSAQHEIDILAYYPLNDFPSDEDLKDKNGDLDVLARDIAHGNNGQFHLPNANLVEGLNIVLVNGLSSDIITPEMIIESDYKANERKKTIIDRMKFVWKSYKQYAWGFDELKPHSKRGDNNWGGMGVTLIDSLDTLFLMGLLEEFNEAKDWVRDSLTFSHADTISVFETTIRELGGLLAAFEWSKEDIFLQRAKELGDLLLPAFDTPSGIPHGFVNLQSHDGTDGWSGPNAILSELGSLQLEFRYLSYYTKNPLYEIKAMKALALMASKHPSHGLYPIKVSISDGSFVDSQVTLGALGDSFYEYLLKVWLQGNKKEKWLREMYDEAVNGICDILLKTSDISGLAFLSDWNGVSNDRKMDHLVCFVPGILALGAYNDPLGFDSKRAKRDLSVAKALMYTCREMYHRTESGISPEYVTFPSGGDIDVPNHVAFYILRPETAESLFILYTLTKDPSYREWAWEIFSSIDKYCKTDAAYAALKDVRNPGFGTDDRMESFFLAETMKYLFLIQDTENKVNLTKYVFNTEAHPLGVFDDSHTPYKL